MTSTFNPPFTRNPGDPRRKRPPAKPMSKVRNVFALNAGALKKRADKVKPSLPDTSSFSRDCPECSGPMIPGAGCATAIYRCLECGKTETPE